MHKTAEKNKEILETKQVVYKRLLNHLLESKKKNDYQRLFFENLSKIQTRTD